MELKCDKCGCPLLTDDIFCYVCEAGLRHEMQLRSLYNMEQLLGLTPDEERTSIERVKSVLEALDRLISEPKGRFN